MKPIKKSYFKGIGTVSGTPYTVTVDGTEYSLVTVTGAYSPRLITELQSQPWWNNSDLAEAIAIEVDDNMGLFYLDQYGPAFVWNEGTDFDPLWTNNAWGYDLSQDGGTVVQLTPVNSLVDLTYAVVVGTRTGQIAAQYHNGTRRLARPIVRQITSRGYSFDLPEDGVQQARGWLTGAQASAAGQCDITALDSEGNQYWVVKLTARRVTLNRKAGGSNHVYSNGQSAPWTFDTASGLVVQIQNG
jgi:hypothetical protein